MSSLRVTSLRGRSGTESPSLPDGAVITGVCTATSFSGDVTGNATGLSGTPNLVVGIITATTYSGIPATSDWRDSSLF